MSVEQWKIANIFIQFISVILASTAAILWAKSALVEVPKEIIAHVVRPDMGFMAEDHYVGQVQSEDLDDLVKGLRKQSRLSSIAAYFAAGAALFQAAGILSNYMSS